MDQALVIRAYKNRDEPAVRDMRLSSTSLYERFFTGTPRVPAHYLRALRRIDRWDRDALVAVAGTEIIGIAEYVRAPEAPQLADFAIMVADAWHRQGVGRALAADLSRLLMSRDITEIRADVLYGNAAARAAICGIWRRPVAARHEGHTIVYRLAVPPTA